MAGNGGSFSASHGSWIGFLAGAVLAEGVIVLSSFFFSRCALRSLRFCADNGTAFFLSAIPAVEYITVERLYLSVPKLLIWFFSKTAHALEL
jgi:hypothetical protein